MKARFVEVAKGGAPFEVVTREVADPKAGQVRIRVQACGVCHSDSVTREGLFPIEYPRVPGHEVVGLVDAVGEDVPQWKVGQRVGVGWYGGHCGRCESCRRGDFITCQFALVAGVSYDGGYADYIVVPAQAVAAVPDALTSAEAAPLLCAGITTFNSLRNTGAKPPDTVAVFGMGGLGHLGVQFAAKMGFDTVAIARGADKAKFAHELGARHYIDSDSENVAESLQKLGGARVILATVPDTDAIAGAVGGLRRGGEFVLLGVSPKPLPLATIPIILQKQIVRGWPSGTAIESEDTLKFSEITGVRPLLEKYPLERAAEAYDRMMSGKARFRVVLETGA